MGYGKSYTAMIVDWLDDKGETGRAAQLCDNLSYGGYSDWFLPSSSELYEMYLRLHNIAVPVGGFSGIYWSSNELGASSAMVRNFTAGNTSNQNKNSSYSVRAARRF
ncbi:MAG: DUF1566 domain-containing protein [Spirochaetes bacterium]|nr:DUF1566 domain-containing protein [Spirochaetota bacterium]